MTFWYWLHCFPQSHFCWCLTLPLKHLVYVLACLIAQLNFKFSFVCIFVLFCVVIDGTKGLFIYCFCYLFFCRALTFVGLCFSYFSMSFCMLVFISYQVACEEGLLLKMLAILYVMCTVHELYLYSRDHIFIYICDRPPQTSSKVGINFLNKISCNLSKTNESKMFSVLAGGKRLKYHYF